MDCFKSNIEGNIQLKISLRTYFTFKLIFAVLFASKTFHVGTESLTLIDRC